MKITEFLNTTYRDAAIYMNYRNTSSLVDGLKNGGRKAVYTALGKNLTKEVKVSNFAGAIIDNSNYLHGNVSMEGTLVNLSQDFTGSNNLPILKGIGAFGTRFVPEAAASRYIFIKNQDYLTKLFKKEDEVNLISQEFEGDKIEPMFYVPTVPLILINGDVGIGVGFSSKILPRSLDNIIKAIEDKLSEKEISEDLFIPYWNGFNGSIKYLGNCKWEIRGKATINGNKVLIEEIPITWNLQNYTQHLKSLRDAPSDEKKKKKWIKKVEKFIDYSENDIFKFEVKLSPEEAAKSQEVILKDLGLIDTITENLVCIDEKNSTAEFKTAKEIFDKYFDIKIKFLNDRKKSELVRLKKEYEKAEELYNFITEVINGTINIKAKKADIEKEMSSKGYKNIDKLISIPLYSISEDKALEAKSKMENKKIELEAMKKETAKSLWLKDLKELKEAL